MKYTDKSTRQLKTVIVPALCLLLFNSCSSQNRSTKKIPDGCTFTNPIMKGADPWVIKKDGFYYFCASRKGGISVSKSEKLTDPKDWKQVWHQPDTGWNRATLWAPELHWIDGKWYIYYAAGESGPPFTSQRAGVLESVSSAPQGDYIDKGKLYTGDHIDDPSTDIWAIDLTAAKIDGQLYAIWSGWKENRKTDETAQHLFIASMSNPWTISSNRVLVSSPEEPWETGGPLDLNEGPEVLKHGDQTFVIYSTRESWLKYYRLGQLKLKNPGVDPLKPDNWIKKGPVFQGKGQVYGVGHASFTSSPDGSEHWIVYHSKIDTTPGWNRNVRTQSFSWNNDGSPKFGVPVNTGEELTVPSGQCEE